MYMIIPGAHEEKELLQLAEKQYFNSQLLNYTRRYFISTVYIGNLVSDILAFITITPSN